MSAALYVLLSLILATTGCFADGDGSPTGFRCFSNMSCVAGEGDFVGLTIILMGHEHGISAVVQEGVGPLEPPFVIDVELENGTYIFDLPPSAVENGIWTGKLDGKDLVVTSPRDESFHLPPGCL